LARRHIGLGHLHISEQARHNVMAMLDASRLSYGPFTREFQAAFARRHGRTRSVFTASGTCALQISLAALAEKHGYGPNDEVLVPTLTFVATSNVVIQQGLRPVFVDVDPITYNIDPNQVERHITDRTRAIVPVHLFGLPCDMAPLQDIAQRHGPQMIEDSAETMFVHYRGRPVGTFGDFACFSTYMDICWSPALAA